MTEPRAPYQIFKPWPHIDEDAIEAVAEVLRSGKINYWTGEQTKAFEREYAQFVGVPYALAVANGTLALELALRAAGIGEGDEVIVPSRTFIATAGAVVAIGATPIICDIDPNTNNMTALEVAKVLTPRTKAVIPVHLGGYPAPVDDIANLAHQVGAVVIEDCAQAHGATYKGKPVGSLGDFGCFSFCQDKIIPLGEGGMITFKDEEQFERAWSYRDHGRARAKMLEESDLPPVEFKWLCDSFGSNARLGEMEGALGRVLLAKLPAYHEARTRNALALSERLTAIEGIEPLIPSEAEREAGTHHAFYRLYARVDTSFLSKGWSRDRILKELIGLGVPVQYGSCALIGNEKAFERFSGVQHATLEGARLAHEQSIAFLVHPTLSEDNMHTIADRVAQVMKRATTPPTGCGTVEYHV